LEASESYESCYENLCDAPLDQGGCGGMGLEVKVAFEETKSCCE